MNGFFEFLGFLYTKPRLSLLLGLLILIVGSVLIRVPQSIASIYWPTTEGIIISSHVTEECCNSYTEGWYPQISYRYSVNQQEYTSNRIELVYVAIQWGGSIQSIVEKYPVGQKVSVYFNPNNPAEAVLEPGLGTAVLLVWMVFAAGSFPVFLGILRVWKERNKRSGSGLSNS
jgi:uncharacterized protein DUF3592